jgi:hypothetical protein
MVEDNRAVIFDQGSSRREKGAAIWHSSGRSREWVMGETKTTTELLPVMGSTRDLPPILAGRQTPAVESQVRNFYDSVAQIFERWVTHRSSLHTQRAYRQDVLSFVEFLGLRWPDEAMRLLTVSVKEVQAFRDLLLEESMAPKTINRRIASMSSFLLVSKLRGISRTFDDTRS